MKHLIHFCRLGFILFVVTILFSTGYSQKHSLVSSQRGPKQITSANGTVIFTEVQTSMQNIAEGTAAFGDYDNDHDLDILITGLYLDTIDGDTHPPHYSKIYRNDGTDFTDIDAGLVGVTNNDGTIWDDYDHDGDLDLFIGGSTGFYNTNPTSKVYKNDDGSFTDINVDMMGLTGTAAWGDYDGDGDLDLIVCGSPNNGGTFYTKLYKNEKGTFEYVYTQLPGVWGASVAWGDYDNDKDLDLLLTGYGDWGVTTALFRNDGGNDSVRFVQVSAPLQEINSGAVSWGDYDNDGDVDILLTGDIPGAINGYSTIYRNDNGSFVNVNPDLAGVSASHSLWFDYDNDGDLDIVLSGQIQNGSLITKIYNNDAGSFTDIGANLLGVYYTGMACGDVDNDGDLDLLVTGLCKASGTWGWGSMTKLYRNDLNVSNSSPSKPANLAVSETGNFNAKISWNPSTDDRTPSNKLTYNVRVGTAPGMSNIVSTASNLNTGYHQVVRTGNSSNRTNFTLKNLTPGTYYWSVQAIDNIYDGSTFTTEESFTLLSNGHITDNTTSLAAGKWHLVSLPNTYSDTRKTTIFPNAISSAYSFSNSVGYATQTTLQNGTGYWLKFTPTTTPTYPVGTALSVFPVPVTAGWNLIGSVDHQVALPENGNIQSPFYAYDGGYTLATSIQSGKGYWVKTGSNGTIDLGSTAKAGTGNREINFAKTNSINITDYEGMKQTLYFGENKYSVEQLNRYELPPVPPTGIFDARFVTQRMLEVVNPGETKELRIKISSASYPVTISWQLASSSVNASITVGATTTKLEKGASVTIPDADEKVVLTLSNNAIVTPVTFGLQQNYPNPFNPSTQITYQLQTTSMVTLKVYDVLGREVIALVNGIQEAGEKSVQFNAENLRSGIYYYTITAGNFTDTKKMLLMK